MSGQNINTHSHLVGKKNSINLYNNSKLDRYISSHNKGLVNTKTTINELIANKKNKNDNNPLKAREEGFNVYLMGANDERVKNIRKKEQLEKNSKRMSNSRSIARKNWEANNLVSRGGLISNNNYNNILGNNAFRLLEKEIEKKESRSMSKNLELKSAGNEIRALLKKDHNVQISHNNYSTAYIKKNIQNHKITAHTRESIANIQSVLNNINAMNKNVADNLKKLNVLESPLSGNGEQTKRFRNFEDAQFSLAFPNLTASAENPNEELRVREKTVEKESEIRIKNDIKLEEDILDNDILELDEKISSDIKNFNDEYDNNNNIISEKDFLISDSKSKDKLPVSSMINNIKIGSNSLNCNNSNTSLINPSGNNQNSLKTSNISLKKSKVLTIDNQNTTNTDIINEFRNSSNNTKETIKRESSNIIIHNFINKELNNNLKKSNNESFPIKSVLNNKTLNTTNDLLPKTQKQESYIFSKNLDDSQDKIEDLTYVMSKVGSSLSPKKKILSAFPSKTRTKSSHKSKNPNQERPFSSILNLLKPRNLKNKNTIYENKSNIGVKNSTHTTSNTLNIRTNNNNLNNNVTSIDTKGNKLNLIPSIQFIYKSPQNKMINQRTLSDLHKAQQSMRKNSIDTCQAMNIMTNLNLDKLITTRGNLNSISNKDKSNYFSNGSNKHVTIENNNKFNNKHLSSKNLNQEGNKLNQGNNNNNFKKNSQILKHFAPILGNNGNNSNNNQQQINKLPSLSNNNSSSNSNSTSNYQAMGSFSNNKSKKKIEILSKIEKLDENKLRKLAKVVEELANHSGEMSQLSLNDSKQFKDSSTLKNSQNVIFRNMTEKYNINYINADSVNFGNININLGNKTDSNNVNKKVDKILTDRTNFDSFKASNNIKTFDDLINDEYISPKFENEKKFTFDDDIYQNQNQSQNLFSPSKYMTKNENKIKEGNFNAYNSNSSNSSIAQRGNMLKNSIKSYLNNSYKTNVNTNAIISSNIIYPNKI